MIAGLLEALISEKRTELRGRSSSRLEALLDRSYGIFVAADPARLSRLVSNLLNNAIEAGGPVEVHVERVAERCEIRVRDNGPGFPAEVLAHLGERGNTHGKPGGSGLGLHYAVECLRSWGGSLRVESSLIRGTDVIASLPLADPPDWFVPGLEVGEAHTFVVIDDDESIHSVWEKRLRSLDLMTPIVHLSRLDEAMHWFRSEGLGLEKARYLVDYEFAGESRNGLEFIDSCAIADRSILVTSRFDEPSVQQRAARLGVRLLPKGLAAYIPVGRA
jgi:hypothetical protein